MAKQTRASRREYWQQIIQRQQASGLSIQRFCRREHLATATFFAVEAEVSPGIPCCGSIGGRRGEALPRCGSCRKRPRPCPPVPSRSCWAGIGGFAWPGRWTGRRWRTCWPCWRGRSSC